MVFYNLLSKGILKSLVGKNDFYREYFFNLL